MKRLLAMLMSLFLSIFNNVDYQAQGDMQFVSEGYYTIDEGTAPDYRDLYGTNPVASKEVSCHPTTFKGSGKQVTYKDENTHIHGYWVVNREGMSYDKLPDGDTYTFENEGYIIMPYTGVLRTSSATSTGRVMVLSVEVGGVSYRLDIQNMERWWCCLGKLEPDDTDILSNPTWVHTCGELLDTQIRQGYVLGNAQEGTTITIAKSDGSAATWKEFYGH